MSVFTKIFLSFWIALALSILATTFFINPYAHPPAIEFWKTFGADILQPSIELLADRYESGDMRAVQSIQDHLRNSRGIRIALYDADKNVLLGGFSTEVLALVDWTKPQSATEIARREIVASSEVQSSSGRTYRVVALVNPRPPGRFRLPPRFLLDRAWVLVLTWGLVCYGLAKYLTTPLLVLRKTAQQVAAGDFSARASSARSGKGDEISGLVSDFNFMAERIESLIDAQRRMTSDISHELRSPLARLSVALGIARKKTGPEAQPALDRIEIETDRLNELVGEILHLAELESTPERPKPVQVDLAQLVERITDDASFEADNRDCKVDVSLLEHCSVMGDPELLRRAMENVVRNSIRYTAPGSTIDIAMNMEGDVAIISVRDHGPGVPEPELSNIFRPFYRVSTDRNRMSGGNGLGLAITARAIRLHKGTVHAENAKDGGLIVYIALPAEKQHSAVNPGE